LGFPFFYRTKGVGGGQHMNENEIPKHLLDNGKPKFTSGWNISDKYGSTILLPNLSKIDYSITMGNIAEWIIQQKIFITNIAAFIDPDKLDKIEKLLSDAEQSYSAVANPSPSRRADSSLQREVMTKLFDLKKQCIMAASHMLWNVREDAGADTEDWLD
jgi:hypothetical protein